MDKKGFVLLETVIVLLVTVIAMLGLYTTYAFVFKNLKQARKYDNINDVYKLYVFYDLKNQSALDSIGGNFVKITPSTCSTYFNETSEVCQSLMNDLEFNYLMYTKTSMDSVLAGNTSGLSNTDINYMKTLEYNFKFLIGVHCNNNDCNGSDIHYVYLKAGEL